MKQISVIATGVAVVCLAASAARADAPSATGGAPLDSSTIARWSAPFRNWHYRPDHVIASNPQVPGFEEFRNTDDPCVYQIPGDERWYLSFIAFNGKGYNSFVAESDDLVHWRNPRRAMGFGADGQFDHGGCVVGAYLYDSWDIKAPRRLKKHDGKYWTLYGSYPRQGGYEMRPGYEGVATSETGLTWQRAKDTPILSVHDPDAKQWEQSCIYQPWLVEYEGQFYDFYNAANGHHEQIGIATSGDLLHWNASRKTRLSITARMGMTQPSAPMARSTVTGTTGSCSTLVSGTAGRTSWQLIRATCLHGTPTPSHFIELGAIPADWTNSMPTRLHWCTTPQTTLFTFFTARLETRDAESD